MCCTSQEILKTSPKKSLLTLEVLICLKNGKVLQQTLDCPEGTLFSQAVALLEQRLKTLDDTLAEQLPSTPWIWGVWSRRSVPENYVLQPNDRLELYRPLKVDPKVARRERFARQGTRGAGLFAQRKKAN